jgi:FkbH-like protein
MMKPDFTSLLIADFNAQNFASLLRLNGDPPTIQVSLAPMDQVVQVLLDQSSICWEQDPDMALIWTRPERVSPSFQRLIHQQPTPLDQVLAEVDTFVDAVLAVQPRLKYAFIPTWTVPSYYRNIGMLEVSKQQSLSRTLMRMNLRLMDRLEAVSNIYFLDTQKLIETTGVQAFNPKLWYMGKIAFSNEVFKEAVADLKALLLGITGKAKKVVVLDLDDTLWGGIVGEVGWRDIRLGGHDHIGEAFVDFQQALKSLRQRGVLLSIVSKNEESVALEAIQNHPEMVLQPTDFAGWRINWGDKAQNIVALLEELNLGADSVIFIDDNPFERARVKEALPAVFVPEWPEDPMLYKKQLLELRCFNNPLASQEDTHRTEMYRQEKERQALRLEVSSLGDWLKELNIKVKVEELNEGNLPRAAQLLNKTNQMNLRTRRMSEQEFYAWSQGPGNRVWTFRVSDRLGDSGLTGIISLEPNDRSAHLVDFLLSCRVLGRDVEEAMLYTAIQYATEAGLAEVIAEYLETPRNKPCLEFWKNSKFTTYESNRFLWRTDAPYPPPESIQIET